MKTVEQLAKENLELFNEIKETDVERCPKCGCIDILYHFDEMFKLHGRCVSCNHEFPADDEK